MIEDNLCTGDAYILGNKVVTNLPQGDKNLAQEALKRIKILSEGKIIRPGYQDYEKTIIQKK